MNKYKYLFKNIGLLTLSSFATKLLSFFLVPLYTNILTTTEYGTYDLFNTTVGVLLPILTLNVQDAVMRFAMDSKSNRKAIISVAMKILLVANTVVAVGLIVNAAFGISSLVKDYSIFFFLMFFMQSLSGVVTYYIRGIDKIADLSVSSVLVSAFTIGCNIVFLAVFHWGLTGYFLANIIGPLVQSLYLIARSRLIHDTDLRADFSEEKRAMLDYCKPMIANSVAWWVNNTSDRYVVIFFCGLAENGIYSVASKIPSILNIFQSIFSQAWTLSAVKDFDPEDKNGFFANTYRAYNCLMVLLCSAIIVADKILAHFLYAKDFFVAWKYVPWLTIAIVFGSLSGYIGGFFSAVKNSKIFAQSTVVGAVSNIVLNLVMTPFMGALGAAIATAVCYFVVWVIRYWNSKKFIKLKINLKRDLITYVLLAAQSIVLLLEDGIVLYGVEIGMFLVIVILYAGDLMSIAKKGKQAVQSRIIGCHGRREIVAVRQRERCLTGGHGIRNIFFDFVDEQVCTRCFCNQGVAIVGLFDVSVYGFGDIFRQKTRQCRNSIRQKVAVVGHGRLQIKRSSGKQGAWPCKGVLLL